MVFGNECLHIQDRALLPFEYYGESWNVVDTDAN